MTEAGFVEVGIVWRMFADTILIAFASGQNGTAELDAAADREQLRASRSSAPGG